MEIVSFAQYGFEGETIKVEADLRRGIPAIDIVGLPDGAVREARERMRAAIRNSGLEFPKERILLNLSPADLKKEGSAFDLPIALAVLGAAEDAGSDPSGSKVMVLGELELSGRVRPVRGILAAISGGLSTGIKHFIVPEGNLAEARIRKEASITGASTLVEAVAAYRGLARHTSDNSDEPRDFDESMPPSSRGAFVPGAFSDQPGPGFEDIRGQTELVRALEIAAAGGHHLIAYGPPGCGKTLALRRFPAILPDLDGETAVTLTRIHSIAGILPEAGRLLVRPPFREPHQNASLEGIIGGGRLCAPGEISLAHGGTLFLDEAALFRESALQALRTPLETGTVTVSRAGRAGTFPARFQLLMAVNPCPCGNFGKEGSICTCAPEAVEKYWKKLTAPLLDRIDLRIAVAEPEPSALASGPTVSTRDLRDSIGRARRIQWERNARASDPRPGTAGTGWLNAHMDAEKTAELCALTDAVRRLFVHCMETARLSGRAGHGILRTARTIADLAGDAQIGEAHLLEAMRLRRWNGLVPDFLL